jgi:hypothetical protein
VVVVDLGVIKNDDQLEENSVLFIIFPSDITHKFPKEKNYEVSVIREITIASTLSVKLGGLEKLK